MAGNTAEKIEEVESNVESLIKAKTSPIAKKLSKATYTTLGAMRFGWHAWLGTAVTLEEKAVSFMSTMATKGMDVESKAKEVLTKRKSAAIEQTTGLRSKAQTKIQGVETMIDKGVNKSLHIIGVPTKNDMKELTSLMKDMSDAISELATQSMPPKTVAKKTKSSSATADVN